MKYATAGITENEAERLMGEMEAFVQQTKPLPAPTETGKSAGEK